MKRLSVPTVAAVFILAACASGSDGPAGGATVAGESDIHWTTAYRNDVVHVTMEDPGARYRVERVALLDPVGQAYAASELTRETLAGDGRGGVRPSVGVGGGYSSRGGFGTGVGLGLSFPLGASSAPEREIRTTSALLPVPDPARYRRTVDRWEIQATMTTAEGETRFARFPAPAPDEARR